MEKYTIGQAEQEAEAMTNKLEKENPELDGKFTGEQYDDAHSAETKEIYKTAMGTLMDLAVHTKIPGAKEIWDTLGDEGFSQKTTGKPHLLELRYKMSEKVIKDLAESEGVRQAVELASGFTPHALELTRNTGTLDKYIESDFPINVSKKQEMMDNLFPGLPVDYVPGNVYDEKLWTDIEKKLDPGSVVIFCEGFMLYTTKEEREQLATNVKSVLEKHGGYFVFEDSMRYHPELKNESFQAFLQKLSKATGRDMGSITQEDMEAEWKERGFKIDRVPEMITLDSEESLPGFNEELDIARKTHKMWKLSLES